MLTIREARAQEYDGVGALTARAYLDQGLLDVDSGYLEALRDARRRAEQAELIVAVADPDGSGTSEGTVPGTSEGTVAGTSEGTVAGTSEGTGPGTSEGTAPGTSEATVLGTVTYCRHGTPQGEISRPGEGEFRMLAVAQAARRQGVAGALVAECARRARRDGCTRLVMCTQQENAAALALYRGLGFTALPERDWEPVPGVRLLAYGLAL